MGLPVAQENILSSLKMNFIKSVVQCSSIWRKFIYARYLRVITSEREMNRSLMRIHMLRVCESLDA